MDTRPNSLADTDYCQAIAGADYDVHQHAGGTYNVLTGEWHRENGEPYCVVIPADAKPKRDIGLYVTAYASDLGPGLIGQMLVMYGRYDDWDDATGTETTTDRTGTYRVRPNPDTRVGSAGPSEHVTLGILGRDLVLDEVTWWATDDVLRMEPFTFKIKVARAQLDWEHDEADANHHGQTHVRDVAHVGGLL